MSNTIASAKATCRISGFPDTHQAAIEVCDYLVNHPDEIPECLKQEDSDQAVVLIESYLSLCDDRLVIAYDTENSDNNDSSIFDWLVSHFAFFQISPFMEVIWIVQDTRSGFSAGVDYYDRSSSRVDVQDLLAHKLANPVTTPPKVDDYCYIICTDSGTIIPAAKARFIDSRRLDGAADVLNSDSDSEVSNFALRHGSPIAYPIDSPSS